MLWEFPLKELCMYISMPRSWELLSLASFSPSQIRVYGTSVSTWSPVITFWDVEMRRIWTFTATRLGFQLTSFSPIVCQLLLYNIFDKECPRTKSWGDIGAVTRYVNDQYPCEIAIIGKISRIISEEAYLQRHRPLLLGWLQKRAKPIVDTSKIWRPNHDVGAVDVTSTDDERAFLQEPFTPKAQRFSTSANRLQKVCTSLFYAIKWNCSFL